MRTNYFKSRNYRKSKAEVTIEKIAQGISVLIAIPLLWIICELIARNLCQEPILPIFR